MELNYIKHKITNLISISKIVTIHYYEFDKNFFFEGESHNFWEMVYIDAGEVEIEAKGELHHLKAGEIIFHKPNEFHTIKAKDSAANVFVISFVCSSKPMDFFRLKTFVVPQKLRRNIGGMIEEYNHTFKPMSLTDVRLEHKDDALIGGGQMIKTLLEQFLILLLRSEQNSKQVRIFPSKESLENHLANKMIGIIEEGIYEKLSVEQICVSLNYSRAYLSKIFKAASGYTVSEYIQMRKIKEAKRLIRENKYNFTQISDMLSFDNPHYFSAVFKRVANITPTEYKNSVKSS